LANANVSSGPGSSKLQPPIAKAQPSLANENGSSGPGSSKLQLPIAKAQEQINDRNPSACSEHFRYLITMPSFEDFHFKKIIQEELQVDPNKSWKGFMALPIDLV
jgi:hypothetical protein